MKWFRYTGGVILACIAQLIQAQTDNPVLTLDGYLSNMQMVMFQDISKDWVTENLFHNRLNIHWYPVKNITGTLQVRNRLIYGETVRNTPGYAKNIDNSDGLLDLSLNIASGNSFVLNSAIDRLWLQATTGKLVTTVGRQRINWGQNLVWNPNDVFNVYSYFDVDYEERPGSDAIRFQFYPELNSTAELAAKIDSGKNITAAGLYRFNILNYDIQFLGGILNTEDYVAGLGFSGNLKGAALRGEMTWFRSIDNFDDTVAYVMTSLGLDYVFNNSLMVQFEFLFSDLPLSSLRILELYSGPLSVKNLAFTRYSIFGAMSYPINPLLQGSFAIMYFPEMKGFFMGPSVTYSIDNNLDLSFFFQFFSGETEQLPGPGKSREKLALSFLRMRWNF